MTTNPPRQREIDESIENDLDFWTEQKHAEEEVQLELIEEEING